MTEHAAARASLCLLVLHDDADREFAYVAGAERRSTRRRRRAGQWSASATTGSPSSATSGLKVTAPRRRGGLGFRYPVLGSLRPHSPMVSYQDRLPLFRRGAPVASAEQPLRGGFGSPDRGTQPRLSELCRPVPDRHVAGRVSVADLGGLRDDTLVVEENLRPVAPMCRHLLVIDVRRGVLGVLPAVGGAQ